MLVVLIIVFIAHIMLVRVGAVSTCVVMMVVMRMVMVMGIVAKGLVFICY